jgi:hypothetical protein
LENAKKVWDYEKWVERHASFPPRQSVKTLEICRGEGVKNGENLSRSLMDGPYGNYNCNISDYCLNIPFKFLAA